MVPKKWTKQADLRFLADYWDKFPKKNLRCSWVGESTVWWEFTSLNSVIGHWKVYLGDDED